MRWFNVNLVKHC